MFFILNIETSTKNCSVSLANSGKVVSVKEFAEEGFSHAEKLHVFIEEVLKETQTSFQELKAVAVSKGPGSYTGLRIGVSAAKGICYALNIPLISVDTLEILARQVKIEKGIIIPMLDARRMEVYSAAFDKEYNKIMEVQAEVLTQDSYAEFEENIYFIGDCQEKCKTILKKPNFHFVSNIIFPSANEMSILSHKKFINQEFEDVAYFEPFYLKDFMITKKQQL